MTTFSDLSTRQKAAAMIVSIGSDAAAQVYKYLRDDEVELLT